MAPTPDPTGDLRIAIGRAARRIRAERGGAGLADPQYTVLLWLNKEGPLTPGQLADLERVQPPSMTRTVTCLADLGLVAKSPHATDGRQVVVSLTQAGEAEVEETRRRRNIWLAAQLDAMTPDERQVLTDAAELLRRIADA